MNMDYKIIWQGSLQKEVKLIAIISLSISLLSYNATI